MAYTVNKVDMWMGEIDDRIGGLAAKLAAVADAGADLQIVVARRQPHRPGKGVVFLGPVAGAKAQKAAAAAGLTKAADLVALRIEGPNKPGDCYRLTRRLADAGINLRGLTATVVGKKYVLALGFDSDTDATKAARLLRAAGAKTK
jgi:hypothetical protein